MIEFEKVEELKETFARKDEKVTSLPDITSCEEGQRFIIKNNDGTYSEYIVLDGAFVNTASFV